MPSTVSDNGAQTQTETIWYGPGWTENEATIASVSDSNPADETVETYGANWHLASASITTFSSTESFPNPQAETQTGTSVTDHYDGNWNLTYREVSTDVVINEARFVQATNDYDASGAGIGGSAQWFTGAATGFGQETWTTGTHQFTLTETSDATLTDVAYDSAGHMTGARILTYNIQGRAFTQTEEDYGANWRLTSWHGTGPDGYDQTVNYMI